MKLVTPYISLEDTLLGLKRQVADSVSYAKDHIPSFNTPEELFYWLRSRVKYTSDPKGIELLQSARTLITGSRLGTPWAGDCDCFTILSLASLIANHFVPVYVILVGRQPNNAVHIYAGVEDGGIVPFDLTNDEYGYERTNYTYQQILPFNL